VLQCVAVRCTVLQCGGCVVVCCSDMVLREGCSDNVSDSCVAVCCSVLQWVAVGCSGLQCVAVCCSVLQ